MPKGSSKDTAALERLLEERRQYEAWIARLSGAEDSTPENVRVKVLADYQARLQAVLAELKAHAEGARQTIDQKQRLRAELEKKEAAAAEKLAESELRHAVGEYDEAQWSAVHKDALAELLAVREELHALDGDLERLGELEGLVRRKPGAAPARQGAPPPQAETRARPPADELEFIKSVTDDNPDATPSPNRAGGAVFQPAPPSSSLPSPTARAPDPNVQRSPEPVLPAPSADDDGEDEPRTLRCRACGTMNLATEWYCEQCGGELAAL
ncbi:MAG TPA: hypothetical protein VLV16_07800 [Gemmatimonadales bacterium]|nr:hypothetical protein [Gemmatimonadales bacterium]